MLVFIFSNVFGECPSGWIKYQDSCFGFQYNASEFASAELVCNGFPGVGHLASIHDGFTNALLADEGTKFFYESTMTDFWIGEQNF